MEKEVSHAVEIGATLIIIAAFMGLVFFTVSMGSTLKQDSHSYAVELSDSISIKALDDLLGKETEVPMATAYNLIAQYSNNIGELVCYYCAANESNTDIDDYVVNPSEVNNVCLARHLYGKCIMKVSKNAGYYQIYIHSPYCDEVMFKDCNETGFVHSDSCSGSPCLCYDSHHGSSCPMAHRGLNKNTNHICFTKEAWALD